MGTPACTSALTTIGPTPKARRHAPPTASVSTGTVDERTAPSVVAGSMPRFWSSAPMRSAYASELIPRSLARRKRAAMAAPSKAATATLVLPMSMARSTNAPVGSDAPARTETFGWWPGARNWSGTEGIIHRESPIEPSAAPPYIALLPCQSPGATVRSALHYHLVQASSGAALAGGVASGRWGEPASGAAVVLRRSYPQLSQTVGSYPLRPRVSPWSIRCPTILPSYGSWRVARSGSTYPTPTTRPGSPPPRACGSRATRSLSGHARSSSPSGSSSG